MRPDAREATTDTLRTFGANNGLLTGRQHHSGAVRGLTILVEFQDVSTSITRQQVDDMLNDANFSANGNVSSAREYFRTVSSGQLDYSNTVVGPFKLSQDRSFYHSTLVVEEALDLAIASGVDLSDFDSRGEDIVDALNIMYAGPSLFVSNTSLLWPHNSVEEITRGGVQTHFYQLVGLGSSASTMSIGTFCHENGHLLCRFPDMYDYGRRDGDNFKSAGIGRYCLMGSGNHLNFGRTPSPVCAYLRDLANWCPTEIDLNTAGVYEAAQGDYATVMKYRLADRPNEYFIVENRFATGLDQHLPSSGLAVYHCDILGSNELQQGTLQEHFQCALIQADGNLDLEQNNNQGDAGDTFGANPGIALSHATSLRRDDGTVRILV